jgi:serine/threonine protein kinase
MFPEMVSFRDGICYDAKALDICSLGVILFEMSNLSKPFGEYTHELIANLPIHISGRLGDEHYIEKQVNRDYKYNPEIDPNISKQLKI